MAEENTKVEFRLADVAFLGELIEERLPLQNMKEAARVSEALRRLSLFVVQQNSAGTTAAAPPAPPEGP